MKNSQKGFVAVLLMSIVVVLFGVLLLIFTDIAPKTIDIFYYVKSSIGLQKSGLELTAQAIKDNNPQLCKKIAPTYVENMNGRSGFVENSMECLINVASTTKNLRACLMMADYNTENSGATDCLIKNSISLQTDYKLCGELKFSTESGVCYGTFSSKLNDLSICNNIQDTFTHDECLRIYSYKSKTPDSKSCEMFVGGLQNYSKSELQRECYSNVALKLHDVTWCQKIDGNNDKCIYDVAVESKDYKVCLLEKNITGNWGRDECLKDAEFGNVSACDLMSAKNRNNCLENISRSIKSKQ